MPVVVVLPALAGFAAGTAVMSGALVGFGIAATMTSAVVAGAVAGAVVGGLGAAITGGDIGEGVLFGAVGGAVGGYLGGTFGPELFGSAGVPEIGGSNIPTLSMDPTMKVAGSGITSEMSSAAAQANVGLTSSVTAPAATSSNDMLMYSLVSGGAEMFKGNPDVPYNSTKEGVTQNLDSQSAIYAAKNEADLEATRIAAAQRQREAELAYKSNSEGLAFKNTELQQTLAQRQNELMTPYQEATAARERATATATGLSAQRRAAEAAQNPDLLA